MRQKTTYILALSLALVAPLFAADATKPKDAAAKKPSAAPRTNPLDVKSTLLYEAPPFNRIKDSDYQPAIEKGMKVNRAEIDKIADAKTKPTFENTIVPMERSGELLTRAAKVFFALTQSNTNETLQKVEAEEAPKLAAHQDAVYLNPKLFARVKAIYDSRDSLGPEEKFLTERYYRNFIKAGAQLNEEDKTALKKLNQEESTLTTKFREHVLGDTKDGALVVSDKAELAGLTDAQISAAALEAKERKLDGKWVLPLQNTTQQPALGSLTVRATREKLFNASIARGNHGGANDNKDLIIRLAQLRAEKAKLLGYPNYAAYSLDDQMAKNPENAIKLMTDLVPGSTAHAHDEAAKMQKIIDAQNGGFQLGPQDWELYSEQVRKAEYDLNEAEVKPYFELDHVLKDGIFYAANQLYGLTFKERHDIPVYHPDVRVFEVFDKDGKSMALWYADYYQRSNKSGGAWEDTFVDQCGLLGTRPVVFNVMNLSKPAAGQPTLLSFDDANGMFHEFGHALHAMLSNVKYPTVAGTNTPRDFVEMPSQFNEHWALQPQVFAHYAKHYKTGEAMPKELVDKIKKSKTFNQGYALTEYLAAALLDMAWHTIPVGTAIPDASAFEKAALQKYNIDMAQVPPRYHSTYFSHIWGGGYSAGYYAYLWAEVIDDDAYAWFEANGGLTRANGEKFRQGILSRGGTEDMAEMYRHFSGHDPSVEPLLIQRGLKEAPVKQ